MYNRQLVSFQANKDLPHFRLFKFKEAFSAELVGSFLDKYHRDGSVLDPFNGSGTTVLTSALRGHDAVGIELLPVCVLACKARLAIYGASKSLLKKLEKCAKDRPWEKLTKYSLLPEYEITKHAYSDNNYQAISKFRHWASLKRDPDFINICHFAATAVLEECSYTRKDGACLRWDHRSAKARSSFDKGPVKDFDEAVSQKLLDILDDARNIDHGGFHIPWAKVIEGSCLQKLPQLKPNSFSTVITSPPYCNRYDYTRTYSLEMAYVGVSEKEVFQYRQDLVCCTVENKEKDLLEIKDEWAVALQATHNNPIFDRVIRELTEKKEQKLLNNSGILRMVYGYFCDLSCIIFELERVLTPGGKVIMVNDNVQYAGISVPVDIILSEVAESFGFRVLDLVEVSNGKGNSSQQMAKYGRDPQRKMIYIWEKQK